VVNLRKKSAKYGQEWLFQLKKVKKMKNEVGENIFLVAKWNQIAK
jgi:hypothetical protein